MGKPQEAYDFLGNMVVRGSWVVFQEKNYRNFIFGRIKDITPKSVLIENVYKAVGDGYYTTTRQDPSQVILVDEAKVPQKVKDTLANGKLL